MVWLSRHETEALHAGRGPLYPPMSAPDWRYQFYGGPDLRGDMVIVVGCDRRYFQYFPNFLLSAIKAQGKSDAGPRIAVHCHVADPQQDQTDFLEQCMGDLNHPPCMLQLSCRFPVRHNSTTPVTILPSIPGLALHHGVLSMRSPGHGY